MDIVTFLLSSTLNFVTFGVMLLLCLETLAFVVWTERLRSRIKTTQDFLKRPDTRSGAGDRSPDQVHAQIHRFLSNDVARARGLLGTLEEVGPILGLMCTFAAFVVALPGFWEDLETDPNIFFAKIGMAMGTSFLGLTIKLLAFVQGRRFDAETETLIHLIDDKQITNPQGKEKQ